MQVITRIDVELTQPQAPRIVYAKQYDEDARYIYATLTEAGQPYDIPDDAYATFYAKKPDGTYVYYDADNDDEPAVTIDGSMVQIKLIASVLNVAGVVTAQISLYDADGAKLSTFNFEIHVQQAAVDDEPIAEDYVNVLTGLVSDAVAARTGAEEAVSEAEIARDAAEEAAAEAQSIVGKSIRVDIAQSFTSAEKQRGRTNIDALKTDEIGKPNLLMNWDFRNPVNQRGVSAFTSNSYGLDMWLLYSGSATVGTEKLTLNGTLIQRFEKWFLDGTPVTLSVMLGDGTVKSVTVTPSADEDVGEYVDGIGLALINDTAFKTFVIATTAATEIKAVKAEMGTVSTLAADAPMDYGTELLRCQRYLQVFGTEHRFHGAVWGGSTGCGITIPLASPMRLSTPTAIGWGVINYRFATGVVNTTSATISGTVDGSSSYCMLNISDEALTGHSGLPVTTVMRTDAKSYLSAEL